MSNSESPSEKLSKLQPVFEKSLVDAFETMVFTPAVCGQPEQKNQNFPTGTISGTIGLTGERFGGRLSLMFSQAVAEQVFRSMMMIGPEDPVEETELKDAIGELANMTAGGAKANLQRDGYDFVISLPAVVVGESHHLESPKNCATAVLPVSMRDNGIFYLEIAIQ